MIFTKQQKWVCAQFDSIFLFMIEKEFEIIWLVSKHIHPDDLAVIFAKFKKKSMSETFYMIGLLDFKF